MGKVRTAVHDVEALGKDSMFFILEFNLVRHGDPWNAFSKPKIPGSSDDDQGQASIGLGLQTIFI